MARKEPSAGHELNGRPVSRRKVLEISAGTALTVGLAGCGSDGDGGDGSDSGDGGNGSDSGDGGDGSDGGDGDDGGTATDDSSTPSGDPVDPRFTTFSNASPDTSHYNPYNPSQYAGSVEALLYENLWEYNARTGEFRSRLAEELSIDGQTAEVSLNTNFKWASDGSQVTATEVAKQIRLEQYVDYPVWSFISGVEAVDDGTLQLELEESYNPNIFRQTLNRRIFFKEGSEYASWLEDFNNASTDEQESLASEFQKWTYASDSDDPVANGPYTLADTSSSKFILEWNENFPYKSNISEYELNNVESDQQTWQMVISGELDGSGNLAVPSNISEQFPDQFHQLQIPANGLYSPMFQFDNPVWGKRAARQGYAYLLDRELVDRNINPRHATLPYVSGLDPGVTQQILGEDWVSSTLTDYGTGSQPEKAAEKFREAGFSKQNGEWVDENGETITLHWLGPQFPGSVGFDETLSQLLPEFGINYESTLVAAPEWISQRQNEEFDLTFNYIGGGPHPYYFLQAAIQTTRSQFGNWPRETVQLPPIGEPDGSQSEVNLQETLQQMLSTSDDSQLTDLTKQYSWYLNQELPVAPMTFVKTVPTMSYDDWNAPEPDADIMGTGAPCWDLLRETEEDSQWTRLQAKTE